MKLWFQSCGALGVDPIWKDYEERLERHLKKVARPDTEVYLRGAKVFSPGVVTYRYDAYLHTAQMVNAAIQAEREGYDAFVQTGTLDLGFYEIREAVAIPVIFPIETALHIATLLTPRVAFMVMNRPFLDYLNDKAKSYGFQDHLTPGGWVNIAPSDFQHMFKNPRPALDVLVAKAKEIGQQGANILICAGNPITMFLVEQGVTQIDGVRILDSLGILVKVAEMMVELHKMDINRDKMGLYAPQPKEQISNVRRLYQADKWMTYQT